MRTHAKRTRTETPPTLFKRRLNANVINEHPWILPYDHKRNVTTIVIRTLEDGRLGQSPPPNPKPVPQSEQVTKKQPA